MNLAKRRIAALLAALLAVAAIAGSVQAAPLVSVEASSSSAASAASRINVAGPKAPRACADRAYRLIGKGVKWREPYRWSFRAAGTPSDLGKTNVASLLKRSFSNITKARNDCGRPDRVDAQHRYVGETSIRPDCKHRDGHNVIGFGRLPFGVLAVTCYWIRNGRMVEADIKINNREQWAMTLRGCRRSLSLEATITHEAGHVFGLGHVGEQRHGRLTMSPFLDGPCQNREVTLGLGDMRGLEALY